MKRKSSSAFGPPRKGLRSEMAYLAQKLKLHCDENGKEIDKIKTAPILNEIGLHFKEKSPEKLSLIRSAALFNAAIIRQPEKLEFKTNLKNLCKLVLETAQAQHKDEDLLAFSEDVLVKIKSMREQTSDKLETLNGYKKLTNETATKRQKSRVVKKVKNLNIFVSNMYSNIMSFISQKCESVLGEAPCKYTLVGMGSLARKEITPYSDFENAIVLEEGVQLRKDYKSILEYFRWFAVIFQIILVNLRETILKFLTIPHLNDNRFPEGDWFYDDFTKCGISPDGFSPHASKNPLGRTEKTKKRNFTTELIKPVSEMVLYLESEEDLKNGYHLADILTKTCCVSGDQKTFRAFQKEVKITLKKNKDVTTDNVISQLINDMNNFDVIIHAQNFQAVSTCDVKRVLYRSATLYIAALGRLHAIDRYSCFEVIECLYQKGFMNEETKDKLSFSVAVACWARLKVYAITGGQDDIIGQQGTYDVEDNAITSTIAEIVGYEAVIDYFVTSFQLQTLVKLGGQVRNFDSFFQLGGIQLRLNVMGYFNMHKNFFKLWESIKQHELREASSEDCVKMKLCVANAHFKLHEYDKCLKILQTLRKQHTSNRLLEVAVLVDISWCLYDMGRYKTAIKHIEKVLEKIEKAEAAMPNMNHNLSDLCYIYAKSKYELQEYEDALTAHTGEMTCLLESGNQHPTKILKGNFLAMCHNNIGFCLVALKSPHKAIRHGKQALDLARKNKVPNSVICASYKLLGSSNYMSGKFKAALEYFEFELKLRLKYLPHEEQDTDEDLFQAIHNVEALQEACHIMEAGGDVIPESMPP